MRVHARFPGFLCVVACTVLAATITVATRGDVSADEKELMAEGGSSYNLYCQSCHGSLGKGDGAVADLLKIAPVDLTLISVRRDGEFPKDEIYAIIEGEKDVRAHGSDMPLWGDAFRRTEETDDEAVIQRKIDGLVVYLEAIQDLSQTAPATE